MVAREQGGLPLATILASVVMLLTLLSLSYQWSDFRYTVLAMTPSKKEYANGTGLRTATSQVELKIVEAVSTRDISTRDRAGQSISETRLKGNIPVEERESSLTDRLEAVSRIRPASDRGTQYRLCKSQSSTDQQSLDPPQSWLTTLPVLAEPLSSLQLF